MGGGDAGGSLGGDKGGEEQEAGGGAETEARGGDLGGRGGSCSACVSYWSVIAEACGIHRPPSQIQEYSRLKQGLCRLPAPPLPLTY